MPFMGESKFRFEALFSINVTWILPRVGDAQVGSEHITEQHIAPSDLCLLLRKTEPYIEGLLKDIRPLAQSCSLKDIVPQNSVSES